MTDKPIYRMSSAGYCPRALSATRLNMVAEQAPKYLESSAKEGNWHETRIKYELHEQDYTVYSEQEEIKIKQELYDLGSIECKRCKYKYLCLPEPKAIEDIDMQILHDNIERYREATKAVKKAQAIADDAKTILQMYASEQPEKKFRLDDMSISVFEVAEKEISYVRKAYISCMIKDLRKEE